MFIFNQAQDQLAHLKVERERYHEEAEENIGHLRSRIQKLETANHDLEMKLEDERRFVCLCIACG